MGRNKKEVKVNRNDWIKVVKFQNHIIALMAEHGIKDKKTFAKMLGLGKGTVQDALRSKWETWVMSQKTYEIMCDYFTLDKETEIPNYTTILGKTSRPEKEGNKVVKVSSEIAEETLLDLIDATEETTESLNAIRNKYEEMISRLDEILPALKRTMEKFEGFDERLIAIEVVMDALAYYSSNSRKEKGEA